MATETGQQIGPYTLREPVGFGASATTYRAFDPRLGRQVALKLVHPHLCANPAFAQRFRAEARRAARIRHRQIVSILDIGETVDGSLYLIMDLVEGTNLGAILHQRGKLPLADVVDLAAQLASALDHLHANGIVHGDIRPAGVMVGAGGPAVLLDFSVAHARTTSEAPRPSDDIDALARLCFELLAGEPAFQGTATTAGQRARSLRERNPDVPAVAASVIERALAGRPEDRYGSAGAFAQALRAAAPRTMAGSPPPGNEPTGAFPQMFPPEPIAAQAPATAVTSAPLAAAPLSPAAHTAEAPTRLRRGARLALILGAVLAVLLVLVVLLVTLIARGSPAPRITAPPVPPLAATATSVAAPASPPPLATVAAPRATAAPPTRAAAPATPPPLAAPVPIQQPAPLPHNHRPRAQAKSCPASLP